jgi:hypothetical protein
MRSRILEATPAIRPLGVGLNLLPHAVRELAQLGLEEPLARKGLASGRKGTASVLMATAKAPVPGVSVTRSTLGR